MEKKEISIIGKYTLSLLYKDRPTMTLEKDAFAELVNVMEDMIVETYWLGDKIREMEGEEYLRGEHLLKVNHAAFLLEGESTESSEEDILLTNDAESDNNEMKKKLMIKDVADIEKRGYEESMRKKHCQIVKRHIRETKERIMEKDKNTSLIINRINEMNKIYSNQQLQ